MRNPGKRRSGRRGARLTLGLVLLLALMLRVWPLSFPSDVNPDEDSSVTRALRMGRDGLNPRWYKYPPLFIYTLFATYGVRYGFERATGQVPSAQAFAERFFANPLPLFIQGRLVSVLFGVLAVWALYLLARRLSLSRPAAAAGALFLAVSPLLVRLSHFALTDGPTVLPFIASLILAVRVLKKGRASDAFWAGVLAGLATAVKYPAGVGGVGLLVAAVGRGQTHQDAHAGRLVGWGLLGAVSAFLSACPWALLDFSRFWQYLLFLGDHVSKSWGGLQRGRRYGPYLLNYLPGALGWPIYLAGLLGLWVWLRREGWRPAIVAGPAVLFWVVMGAAKTHFSRFALAMLPALVLSASRWIDHVSWRPKHRAALLAGGMLVMAGPPLAASLAWDLRTAPPDTRTLATSWIERNIPAGARVLSESYGPRLAYTPDRAREIAAAERARNPKSGAKFAHLAAHPPARRPAYRFVKIPMRRESFYALDADWYDPHRVNASGIEWVVLSSAAYGRYARLGKWFPRQVAFGRWLSACWEEAARFGPFEPVPEGWIARRLGQSGPTLRVFRRKKRPPPGCRKDVR
ncbi:MAG: glycosyltransferase family 39 protein [Nitrospinota bacterium]|nr:glycosyltransferase family 39 protein [Nitrospinota bacterium]